MIVSIYLHRVSQLVTKNNFTYRIKFVRLKITRNRIWLINSLLMKKKINIFHLEIAFFFYPILYYRPNPTTAKDPPNRTEASNHVHAHTCMPRRNIPTATLLFHFRVYQVILCTGNHPTGCSNERRGESQRAISGASRCGILHW